MENTTSPAAVSQAEGVSAASSAGRRNTRDAGPANRKVQTVTVMES